MDEYYCKVCGKAVPANKRVFCPKCRQDFKWAYPPHRDMILNDASWKLFLFMLGMLILWLVGFVICGSWVGGVPYAYLMGSSYGLAWIMLILISGAVYLVWFLVKEFFWLISPRRKMWKKFSPLYEFQSRGIAKESLDLFLRDDY